MVEKNYFYNLDEEGIDTYNYTPNFSYVLFVDDPAQYDVKRDLFIAASESVRKERRNIEAGSTTLNFCTSNEMINSLIQTLRTKKSNLHSCFIDPEIVSKNKEPALKWGMDAISTILGTFPNCKIFFLVHSKDAEQDIKKIWNEFDLKIIRSEFIRKSFFHSQESNAIGKLGDVLIEINLLNSEILKRASLR